MPKKHKVRFGDGISVIAFKNGFHPNTLWDHADNKDLRAEREHPNSLVAGDIVVVPDKKTDSVSVADQSNHSFRRLGTPDKIRLQLLTPEGEARAGQEYTLSVDSLLERKGKTDGDGVLEEFVPPTAYSGYLTVGPDELHIDLTFRALESIQSDSGVQARLQNLGYDCDPVGSAPGEATQEAIAMFQSDCGLTVTGEMDDETRDKLAEIHDEANELPQEEAEGA